MTKLLNALCDAITGLAKFTVAMLIAGIVSITIAAVYWRYVLNAPLAWPEQVSRIMFVWVTFVGAAVLYRERLHIAIDMFMLMTSKRIQAVLFWVVDLLVMCFCGVMLVFGGKLSFDVWDNTFGALDITPASFYLAAPVSAAMMILFFVEKIFDPRKRVSSGAPSTLL